MGIQLLIPLVVMFGLMWWMTRSQKKQQQQRQEQLNTMKPGDHIVTIGGLHGVLSEINKDKGIVTIDCDGIFLDFDRSAIKNIRSVSTETVQQVATEQVEEKNEQSVVEKSDDNEK